jgi:hypothetical protein
VPRCCAERDRDQGRAHRLDRGIEREDRAEQAGGDDEARHEEVDACDEGRRHLAAALGGRELVQLLLRGQERDPVADACDNRARDE